LDPKKMNQPNQKITFAYSPCPNDTFSFHALVHGLVGCPGFEVRTHLADVEELNRLAFTGRFELSKLSFHALGHLLDKYALLRSGSALGRGCGPLLIARSGHEPRNLKTALVAVPGKMTTAHMLLSLNLGAAPKVKVMEFSRIMDAVLNGEVEAGLIIHESRFTYQEKGLVSLMDLGEWWEAETGLPIPLGCIAARRDVGKEAVNVLEQAITQSIRLAWEDPGPNREYIRENAQEMEPDVVRKHIELYVNQYSEDLGEDGVRAVEEMLERGRSSGLIPECGQPLFI
jgi:1,4-dihydroxy-6-naphthoate synthase